MPKKYSPRDPRPNGRFTKCSTCKHPERERIEMLSCGGASLESLAEKFSTEKNPLTKHCLSRHMRNHVAPETKEALAGGPAHLNQLAERAAKENMSILDYLQILRSTLMRQLTNCNIADDAFSTSRLAATLLAVLQEIGRLTGEISNIQSLHLHRHGHVLLNDPAILNMQSALLAALQPFPEARRAVIVALRELEAADAPMPVNGHAMLAPPREIEGVLANG